MDTNDYYQQLQTINQMLDQTLDGPEREELLSLKHNIEELLSLTNDNANIENSLGNTNDNKGIDDEYAMFMTEMAKEGAIDLPSKSETKSYKELEGKRFKAPHKHQWGQVVYHNAMISSVPDEIQSNEDFQVRVLFLNPTHKEMLPCPYYFDLERDCNFSEDQCHFSHGELVSFSSLQEYIEPKFELLAIGSAVLAKQSNNLWCRAKIIHILKGKCLVKFDSKSVDNQNFQEIIFEDILPLENSENCSDNDSSGSDNEEILTEGNTQSTNYQEEIINMSLMNTCDNELLGDWEKYTKGIGSKLLQKMGYIVGTGLGKQGTGIVKPVTALVLPTGKSLDFCMNLKEQYNNPDLFSAEKKAKTLQRKLERKQKRLERQKKIAKEKMDVCDFINVTLAVEKDVSNDQKDLEKLREKLKSGSDKDLHVANFTTEEKIKKQKEAIEKIKRVMNGFTKNNTQSEEMSRRLYDGESGLKKLKNQALMIKNEINRRKNNKEMAVF